MAGLALFWGSGFLWIKLALRGFNPVQIVFVRLLLGFVTLTPIALSRGLRFPRDSRVWGHLFVSALVANAIPYVLVGFGEQTVGSNVAGALNAATPLWTLALAFLNYRIIEDQGATAASTVTYLLPIVAVMLGWLVLHESITPTITLGIALILIGIALTRRRPVASIPRHSVIEA